MTGTIEAVYEQGILRPLQPLALAEGMKVNLILLESESAKIAAMREAMTDLLFLADLRGIADDFKYADADSQSHQSHFTNWRMNS